MRSAPRRFLGVGLAFALACAVERSRDETPTRAEATCEDDPIAVARAPGIGDEHLAADFFLARLAPGRADEVLLDGNAIAELNAKTLTIPGAWRDILDDGLVDSVLVNAELAERMAYLEGKLSAGEYLEGETGAFEAAAKIVADAASVDELRPIVVETQLYCIPTAAGLFTSPRDPDFDRNHCASLHPGDLVRVLRVHEAWTYVRSEHSVGWIREAKFGPSVDRATVERARERFAVVTADDERTGLRMGTALPLDTDGRPLVPRSDGLGTIEGNLFAPGHLPFTRRRLFELAFSELDAPYGWGGRAGGRDCSSYLYDLFAVFGIHLARHSAVQAEIGREIIDLAGASDDDKQKAIRGAAERGVLILYMPGHVLLYLGHDEQTDYAISSLSEYLEPCPGGKDTVYRLDRVTVTTLDLGRGSERTSFLERITKVAVF